ncbi:MAG: MarR family transcriptional regulator [Rhodobacteraceae bacterium]|nr:MarR family transcriptional regulator [Paracoccaceae bacterium]
MAEQNDPLPVAVFSEILVIEQMVRNRVSKALPKGMELSHFSVLNHLAHAGDERSPAQLAKAFHVTRGAMTNTLSRLEWAGYVHIRPDWEDARRKKIAISPAGRQARDAAMAAIGPIISDAVAKAGSEDVRRLLPVLREMRRGLIDD